MKRKKIYIQIKKIMKNLINISLRMFWIFPIKSKNIFFISYGGLQYSCNPKYISEYLNNNNASNYNIVWAFKDIEKFRHLEHDGIKMIKYGGLNYLKKILTSKIIITNNSINSYLPIRSTQKVLNTWHGGGAYKKVVSDRDLNGNKIIKETSKLFDLFVSTCRLNSDLMIKGTFGYEGRIIETGFPRNDIFFTNNRETRNKVYKYFNLKSNCNYVLYAPTFRDGNNEELYKIDINGLLLALENRFGGNWVFMFRGHHAIKEKLNFKEQENIVDATDYEDMQELLYSADFLITDYSSSIWDFSLMKRPLILFAEDLDSYAKERNFYIPIKEWGFPIAKNNIDLINLVNMFNIEEHEMQVEKHFKFFGSFETGNATEKVANEIIRILESDMK